MNPTPRLLAGVAASVLAVAGCQTKPPLRDYTEYRSARDPVSAASQISRNVRACWLIAARPAFADLTSAAELTSYTDRPRVLLVEKGDREGLPRLVIEASPADRGASLKLFGPLLATAEASAIRRDVARWANGDPAC